MVWLALVIDRTEQTFELTIDFPMEKNCGQHVARFLVILVLVATSNGIKDDLHCHLC